MEKLTSTEAEFKKALLIKNACSSSDVVIAQHVLVF